MRDESDDAADRDHLVLDEVLLLKPPKARPAPPRPAEFQPCWQSALSTVRGQDIPIDFSHLGTLFVLDENLDGRVTMKEVPFAVVRDGFGESTATPIKS